MSVKLRLRHSPTLPQLPHTLHDAEKLRSTSGVTEGLSIGHIAELEFHGAEEDFRLQLALLVLLTQQHGGRAVDEVALLLLHVQSVALQNT